MTSTPIKPILHNTRNPPESAAVLLLYRVRIGKNA